MDMQDICVDALMTFGTTSQIDMAIEECAELINALQKRKRGRASKEDIITEIADVTIMMCQMSYLYGKIEVDKQIDFKLKRLEERIENYKLTE